VASALRRQLVSIVVIGGLVVGMPALAYPQEGPQGESQESAQQKQEKAEGAERSAVEDSALGVTSVLVSAGQIPLRALTCGATAVVAGLAYLLTAFDRGARDGPGEAIGRVCGGPYTTTPEDLKGG